jgi:hypothetical protein
MTIAKKAIPNKPCSSQNPADSLAELTNATDHLISMVRSAVADAGSFDELERKVHRTVLQIGWQALDLFIELQGNGDVGEQVQAKDGSTLTRSQEKSLTKIRSIFGTHQFEQFTYAPQLNKRIELRPISARMSLPENQWSFLLQEFSQMLAVDSAFSLAAENLGKILGGRFAVDTIERINQSMGQHAEDYLHRLPKAEPHTEAEFLVASADCKGVPMVKEDTKRIAAFEQAKKNPGNRRMATVASVYTIEPHYRTAEEITSAMFREELPQELGSEKNRPRPQNKNTSAHLPVLEDNGDGTTVEITAINMGVGWIAEQIEQRRRADQKLLVLQDGQECLWDTIEGHVEFNEDTIPILDILHVLCYLWAAAGLFSNDEKSRKATTRKMCLSVLQGKTQGVIRGLRTRGTRHGLRGDSKKELDRICGYLEKNLDRMRYDVFLAAGYPIASGVIEGACRHLVKDRMERSGMRWRIKGATSMLHVRAMHQSNHLQSFLEDRIKNQVAITHKNQYLVNDYQPTVLAC